MHDQRDRFILLYRLNILLNITNFCCPSLFMVAFIVNYKQSVSRFQTTSGAIQYSCLSLEGVVLVTQA